MKSALAIGAICLSAMLLALAVVAPAHAAVQVNSGQTISLSVFVPCAAGGAGELVDLSGTLHTLITFAANKNNVAGYLHSQPQGISGVGETTGDKYQATGVTLESFGGSLQNGQFNQTFVNNFRIIGQGPGNNFLVHETVHITVNANGSVTVFHDDFSAACK
jgi:hypothetical protein